jgi:sialate O-acetylesterase
MALPLSHTVTRNDSVAAIGAGRYSKMRLFGLQGNMNVDQNWTTLKAAVAAGTFESFSATCYYFGESLVDQLGDAAPPIGLIHTAWGGSTIEQWLDNTTISTCSNATLSPQNQMFHDNRVLPWVDMTLKGWVWYQVRLSLPTGSWKWRVLLL